MSYRKDQVIADGPFIDAKEGIAGFDIILAENLDQAAEIALTCPLVRNEISIIEARPIDGIKLSVGIEPVQPAAPDP